MLRRLRKPEYTGDDRCYPCTVVNLAISAVMSVVVGVSVSLAAPTVYAVPAGLVFLVVALASVWLRGYLVPGTPTLTKRYLPERVLALFGKAPGERTEELSETEVEEVLTRAGAVRLSKKADDLVLTEEFESDWEDAIREVDKNPDADEVLAEVGFDPSDDRIERHDGAVAVRDGAGLIRWPSEVALRVDLAGARVLADRLPGWNGYRPAVRATVLRGLRIFLEECPEEGRVEMNREAVESCCSVHQVVVLSCSETGDRLVEQEV